MNVLLLTALDYRTPRKANLHFIAEEFAAAGHVTRFFSLRYSLLSRWKADPRIALDARANRVERRDGIDCFLWKTLLHPFNTRRPALKTVEDLGFAWYARRAPAVLRAWIAEADTIFFESGSSILFIELARRINPAARTIYIASDDLATIEVAPYVADTFARRAPELTAVCLTSPRLADGLPRGCRAFVVPHGIDGSIATRADPSPYETGVHAVAVGSMLFDRTFFDMAGPAFPDVTFHVIGSGLVDRTGLASNVRVYDEMAHDETLRFIKHADVGIAPYRPVDGRAVPAYLADTSMKLMQYDFFGLPAVCPEPVDGDVRSRFGYRPGTRETIVAALRRALAAGRFAPRRFLGWDEVAARLLRPEDHPELALGAAA